MADTPKDVGASAPATGAGPAPTSKPPNPVFKMMGLPNFRLKLPSRNWLIFLSITGSWTAAVVYDRREKKRIQRKWCDAVAHLSQETIQPSNMPRRLTVYLSAPPADGLLTAREHFHEYVKPILVSAGMDWDAEEGRKEGDVRAGLAERIRKMRKMAGENSYSGLDETDKDVILHETRERGGVKEWNGVAGDIVIGRNTWKEYVRGLHEGWLGPLDPPPEPKPEPAAVDLSPATPEQEPEQLATSSSGSTTSDLLRKASPIPLRPPHSTEAGSSDSPPLVDDASPTTTPADAPIKAPEAPAEPEKPTEPKKPKQPSPFIATESYSTSSVPRTIPHELAPSTVVRIPHILGFRNTPIRMYRFLTRRHVADEIGQQVASVCLAAYRPYEKLDGSLFDEPVSDTPAVQSADDVEKTTPQIWEQERELVNEEPEWHKSIRNREREVDEQGKVKESVWQDPIVLDQRIAGRMRRFVLTGPEAQDDT